MKSKCHGCGASGEMQIVRRKLRNKQGRYVDKVYHQPSEGWGVRSFGGGRVVTFCPECRSDLAEGRLRLDGTKVVIAKTSATDARASVAPAEEGG